MLLSRRFRFSEFVIVFGSARLYCMPGALLCSRHRRGHQVVLRDIVHTMHNDHELLYKSWRDALVYNYVLKNGLDMTTFSTCMALFIRNVSSYKQDSLWSWFICVCYTICVILTVGLTFSLGVLFPVLMDSFHEDRERTGRSAIITIRTDLAGRNTMEWCEICQGNFSLVSSSYNNNNLLFKNISLLCLVSVIPMSEGHVILPIQLSLRAVRKEIYRSRS